MNNFVFRNPTKIIFGKDTIASIAKEIPVTSKVMITYGGGSIKKSGIYQQVMEALSNHAVIEFGGIAPNPKFNQLMEGVKIARQEHVSFLLAVGGGSVIDGTKFISVAVNFAVGNEWEILFDAKTTNATTPVPLATILTLPATGSEMNCGAVISREDSEEKYPFFHEGVYPQFSVLDPSVCRTLPKRQLANGIIDSFVHTLEQYLTFPVDARIQDRFSEGILQTLIEIAPKVMEDKFNYDAVSNLMWSATLALNGLIGAGVPQDWSTHMIGHELTALKGLDHAVTLAIIYPALISVMRNEKEAKLIQYAARVWGVEKGTKEERIAMAIKKTRSFFESLGVRTTLSAYDVDKNTIGKIVARFAQRNTKLGEHGTITPEVVKRVLEIAL